jgi:hypothetical protein
MKDKDLFGKNYPGKSGNIRFPEVRSAQKLKPDRKRLFIGAYGFEQRSLGWPAYQAQQGSIFTKALVIRYMHSKGRNRIKELRNCLSKIGVSDLMDFHFNNRAPYDIEDLLSQRFQATLGDMEEVVLDISAMTKLLILVCLCNLRMFTGTIRIVYSEADAYSPSQQDYEKSKHDMAMIATYPTQGFESIVRMKCLSSIRMQGQPVTMVAFTSFNEQLVRHMLGTINPHRLLFINGRPPREDFAWRETATQEIHNRLIEEYPSDNIIDSKGLLKRATSTLEYTETVYCLKEIYDQFGTYERIICAATGSKMQTVGLFFSKMMYPEIHLEYPTPDSYFSRNGVSKRIRSVHEIVIPEFADFLKSIKSQFAYYNMDE